MKGRQAAFEEAIQEAPVIAAVKNDMGLAHALRSECAAVFILYGTILDIGQIVKRIKAAGKLAFVHADLIEGLSNRGEIAVDFLAEATKADGIISTRPQLIKHAKELSLYTVMRFFVIDSMAYDNIEKQLHAVRPDFIEILPALMPKVISRICDLSPVPVIAGGLISDKEDVMQMIQAGAISISSTNEKVWFL